MLIFTGQLDKAADVLRPAIARFPEVGDLKAYEVSLALAQGQAQLAQSLVERLPAQTSNQVVVSQIETPLITGDYQAAIDAWELPGVKAYESNRGFIGNRESSRAWAYALMGARETARSEARACVERLSDLPPVPDLIRGFEMIYLGHCYLFLDEPELAIRAADEAQAMIPESKDRYFGGLVSQQRVLILAKAGKRDAALVELERLFSTVFPISKSQLQIDHRWDFFRDDERFNELIRPEGVDS
jgi:tetratricopeptide (TPR) repeat protein